MNLRTAVSILLPLTLAGTALCQSLERVAPKPGHQITWQAPQPLDMVIVLASWRSVTVNVDGNTLLDGPMVKLISAVAAGNLVDLDLPPAVIRQLDADLYVQAISVRVAPALMIDAAPIQKLQIARAVAAAPTDQCDGSTWSRDETEELFASNLESLHVSHLIDGLEPTTFGLYAEFTGRNSGYDLKSAGSRVVDGRTQVYLQVKVPGEGEGDLDIVEMHQLLLHLGQDGRSTDVHVAITDGRRHTAYRPFGSFDQK